MTPIIESETLLEGVTLSRSANVVRVASKTPLRVLGCASIGDDLALTRNIVAMSALEAPEMPESSQQLHNWAIQAGIHEPYVGVVTSGSVDNCVQISEAAPKWSITVLVFADLSLPCSAGNATPSNQDAGGGIDIIILTDASLSMGAMVSATITATEAKVRALVDNRIATEAGNIATGAPADSVIVACLSKGERIRRAGPTTEIGYLVGKVVHDGLTRVLQFEDTQ